MDRSLLAVNEPTRAVIPSLITRGKQVGDFVSASLQLLRLRFVLDVVTGIETVTSKVRPIRSDQAPSSSHQSIKKPHQNQGLDGVRWLLKQMQVTPTGLEPVLPP